MLIIICGDMNHQNRICSPPGSDQYNTCRLVTMKSVGGPQRHVIGRLLDELVDTLQASPVKSVRLIFRIPWILRRFSLWGVLKEFMRRGWPQVSKPHRTSSGRP